MGENKIWRPVVGFEKYFECCVDGRFKRLTRVYYNSLGKKITLKEKIVNGSYRNGYYHFNAVGDNKEHLDQGVHIFIAQSFPEICGEWFDGCEVHHKDGNSQNNEATNLIVCTKEQHWEYHRILKNNRWR